jgi:microsomal epoxide hydrolase
MSSIRPLALLLVVLSALHPLAAQRPAVTPFTIAVPEPVMADLRQRLAAARFPDEIPGAGWDYGTDLTYLRELVAYWRERFDWRAAERRLNQFPQFTTTIDGLDVHFIHARSRHPNALPLAITHGWPGSIVEFAKIVGPLTDPTAHGGRAEDAFHVVAMSLPGFGFSGKPRVRGFGPERMAATLSTLMARLGYARYGVPLHGGE